MERKYVVIVIILLFVFIYLSNIQVQAKEIKDFETEEMTKEDEDYFFEIINLIYLKIEPQKKMISCFDVNENGMIAVGFSEGSNKTICIYSEDGIFQYGYKFFTEGTFGVGLYEKELKIYLARGGTSITCYLKDETKLVERISNTSENSKFWYKYVYATSKNSGDYQYILRNDIGILGVFLPTYSQILRVDLFGNETLIYDVNSAQLVNALLVFIGIVLIICFTSIALIKEVQKLKNK